MSSEHSSNGHDAPSWPLDRVLARAWMRDDRQSALLAIVQGVVDVLGYQDAAVSVIHGEEYRVVAVAGGDAAVRALRDRTFPAANIVEALAAADQWGGLRYVPHHRVSDGLREEMWVEDAPAPGAEGYWHPADVLAAPLHDARGATMGTLSVNLAPGTALPDAESRAQLEAMALHAARALTLALEQELEVRHRARTATARLLARRLGTYRDLDTILDEAMTVLLDGFDVRAVWAVHRAGRHWSRSARRHPPGSPSGVPTAALEEVDLMVDRWWAEQQVGVVDADLTGMPADAATGSREQLGAAMRLHRVGSVLVLPMGVGDTCLGHFTLVRDGAAETWSEREREVALDIGHDIGRAVLTARTLEDDQRAVAQLQSLDAYKQELISTFSHELRTPLTSLVGHLELLDAELGEQHDAAPSLAAMHRGVRRLDGLVSDLLTLSRLLDPALPVPDDAVDLAELVLEMGTEVGAHVEVATRPRVRGSDKELRQALAALLSQASGGRGQVYVVLRMMDDRALVDVCRAGPDATVVSARQLLESFSSDGTPQLRQRGAGLALRIAEQIVARHEGRVLVTEDQASFRRFTIDLPATEGD